MKKIILILSLLSLFAYGCNKQETAADMQKEDINPGPQKENVMKDRMNNSSILTNPDQRSGTEPSGDNQTGTQQ
jgi:hypothetical protein